ncbi:MAG: hypothetical protein IIA06_11960 [Proteobacteria bacterium]|nr:hypothetical protein [Pseudomonadota bacterium]
MSIQSEVSKSEALAEWLTVRIDGLVIPSPERCRVAAGCFDMVLEFHAAIVLLTKNSLFGAAAALVRSLFEAHVRGIWFLFCASDAELEAFKDDKMERNFGDLIREIEEIETYSEGIFSDVKKKSWRIMNSFTHTGYYQVVRRNTENEIRPNYKESEVLDALSTANSFAILTGVEIANMAKNSSLTKEIADHGNQYFKGAL